MNILIDSIKTSVQITGLVMIMMLLIEYVNIKSNGKSFASLQKSKLKQVLFSTFLGMIPGCVGGFAVVSLFTHRIVSFGSLVAMMIASSGDEAFIMMAMIPDKALILFAVLAVIAIGAGLLADKIVKVKAPFGTGHYEIHSTDSHDHFHIKGNIKENLKKLSKERVLLILGIVIFIVAMITGLAGHEHAHTEDDGHSTFNIFDEKWINIVFIFVSFVTLYLTLSAKEHFIKEHLWEHVIKKHFKSIFLWTLGALIVIHFGMGYLNIESWIKDNVFVMIFLAVLIGLIPESGPHIIFITLFASGVVPFSVLLASSIAQDGHTALPLLAESKRCFLKAKLFNMIIGFTFGAAFHLAGF